MVEPSTSDPKLRVQALPLLNLAENGRWALLIGRLRIEKIIAMTI